MRALGLSWLLFFSINSALLVSALHGGLFPASMYQWNIIGSMKELRELDWVPGAEPGFCCTPRYVDGRVFVTEVLPESQAEVDEVVLAGDILDEINGCSLRNAYNGQVGGHGGLVCPPHLPLSCPHPPLCFPFLQAGAVLQKLKGQPLSFRLLRWWWHDGGVYEPLLPYLKVLKEKEPQFQLQRSPRGEGQTRRLQGGR